MVTPEELFKVMFRRMWVLILLGFGLGGAGVATVVYVAVHFLRKVW